MRDEPEAIPFSEIKRLRGDLRRPMPLPQEFTSLEAYHEAKLARQQPPRPTRAEVGYPRLKGR